MKCIYQVREYENNVIRATEDTEHDQRKVSMRTVRCDKNTLTGRLHCDDHVARLLV